MDSLFPPITVSNQTVSQAIAAFVTKERREYIAQAMKQGCANNPFGMNNGFRLNGMRYIREFKLESHGTIYDIELKYVGQDYEIKINGSDWIPLSVQPARDVKTNRSTMKLNLGGDQSIFSAVIKDDVIDVFNEVSDTFHHTF